ncbi:universal stress protein [Actinocorallia lasiicapitis]
MTYRSILVGTDGSATSFRAVDKAASLAGDTGATLVLVSAYHPMPEKDRLAAADTLGDLAYKVQGATPAEDVLRAARERAIAAGAKDVQEVALEGDAVDVLTNVARDRAVDLVVVGNRGLNSLAGRLLGSVPANLSHKSPVDVLIVHTTDGK